MKKDWIPKQRRFEVNCWGYWMCLGLWIKKVVIREYMMLVWYVVWKDLIIITNQKVKLKEKFVQKKTDGGMSLSCFHVDFGLWITTGATFFGGGNVVWVLVGCFKRDEWVCWVGWVGWAWSDWLGAERVNGCLGSYTCRVQCCLIGGGVILSIDSCGWGRRVENNKGENVPY